METRGRTGEIIRINEKNVDLKRRAQNVQAPIIVRCNNLHSSVIRRIDPQLWEKLENEGVEAQLWAMSAIQDPTRSELTIRRWYKLIFTREIPFGLSLRLWDGIFAEDPGLGILDFIAVAMVLLIRNECKFIFRHSLVTDGSIGLGSCRSVDQPAKISRAISRPSLFSVSNSVSGIVVEK